MKIDITLKNYRCFQQPARISLRTGLTGFVGVNNAGKSSLLKFFYEFRPLFNQLSSGKGLLDILRANHVLNLNGIQDNQEVFSNANTDFLEIWFDFEADDDPNRDLVPRRLVVTVLRPAPSMSAKLYLADGPAQPDGNWRFQGSMLFSGNTIKADLEDFFQVAKNLANALYIGPFRNIINVGTKGDYFDISVGQSFVQAFRRYKTGLNSIQQNEATYKLIKDIQAIFEFADLDINPSPDDQTLQIFVNGKSYQLSSLGSGLAQFIVVLANAMIRKPAYILIDEPELNLHPSLQLDFLTTLASHACEGVWFATHTLGLARASADRIYSVRKNAQGDSTVAVFEDTPNLTELVGELSFAGYRDLGADKILLVEGRTEVKTIQQWLRLWRKDHRTIIVPIGGNEYINASTEVEFMELTRLSNNISVLIDSERNAVGDTLSRDRQAFVEMCGKHSIPCFVLERRATENYFSDQAVKTVKGAQYRALTKYENLKTVSPRWGKRDNWRIAREMTRDDLRGTDLEDFFEAL